MLSEVWQAGNYLPFIPVYSGNVSIVLESDVVGVWHMYMYLIYLSLIIERFSIECCKTKTKAITLANH